MERALPRPRMRVNLRRKPWSVPRLRGRGEQGNIVVHTLFLSVLYVRTSAPLADERPRRVASHPVGYCRVSTPIHHLVPPGQTHLRPYVDAHGRLLAGTLHGVAIARSN